MTLRVNDEIVTSPVRLVGFDGEQVGVVGLPEARRLAADAGLDLVEVSPHAEPPVVKLMDAGEARASRKRNDGPTRPATATKEVRFRPGLDEVDYAFKMRHGRRFLEEGHRVEFVVPLPSGAEQDGAGAPEVGARIAQDLEDVGSVDVEPGFEGRTMRMVLAPLTSR